MKDLLKEHMLLIILIGFWTLFALYDLIKTALTN